MTRGRLRNESNAWVRSVEEKEEEEGTLAERKTSRPGDNQDPPPPLVLLAPAEDSLAAHASHVELTEPRKETVASSWCAHLLLDPTAAPSASFSPPQPQRSTIESKRGKKKHPSTVRLVTFSHVLPPPAADLPGTCRFLYSARLAGGFSEVFVVGVGMRPRDKMGPSTFRRALLSLLNRFDALLRHRRFLHNTADDYPVEEEEAEDLVVYSDMFDVVVLASIEVHRQQFQAYFVQGEEERSGAGGEDPSRRGGRTRRRPRCDQQQSSPRQQHAATTAITACAGHDSVVFQGDRTSFCPTELDAYAAVHRWAGESRAAARTRLDVSLWGGPGGGNDNASGDGSSSSIRRQFEAPVVQKDGTVNDADEVQRKSRRLFFFPFPNTGWFMGHTQALRKVLPLVLPQTAKGGIDQGHVCAEAARQGLLEPRVGLVAVDADATLSLNMNPPLLAPKYPPHLHSGAYASSDQVNPPHRQASGGSIGSIGPPRGKQRRSIADSGTTTAGLAVRLVADRLADALNSSSSSDSSRKASKLLAVHFSGPSKQSVLPRVLAMLRQHFDQLWTTRKHRKEGKFPVGRGNRAAAGSNAGQEAEAEEGEGASTDWRLGMELVAMNAAGSCNHIPVRDVCPPGNPF